MLTVFINGIKTSEALFDRLGGIKRRVEELPQKLRHRAECMIRAFASAGVRMFWYIEPTNIILPDEENERAKLIAREHARTVQLISYYLDRHIFCAIPGTPGGDLICKDCGEIQPRGVIINDRCQFGDCPSHAMWAEIFENYVPPNDSVLRALSETRTVFEKYAEPRH